MDCLLKIHVFQFGRGETPVQIQDCTLSSDFFFFFFLKKQSSSSIKQWITEIGKRPIKHYGHRCCHLSITLTFTWMRLAAGFLLFSKCFWRCCSCTFNAKPEPRMPWNKIQKWHSKISKALLNNTNIKKSLKWDWEKTNGM